MKGLFRGLGCGMCCSWFFFGGGSLLLTRVVCSAADATIKESEGGETCCGPMWVSSGFRVVFVRAAFARACSAHARLHAPPALTHRLFSISRIKFILDYPAFGPAAEAAAAGEEELEVLVGAAGSTGTHTPPQEL